MRLRNEVFQWNVFRRLYIYCWAMYEFYVIPENALRRVLILIEAMEHLFVKHFRNFLLQYPSEIRFPWPPPAELSRATKSLGAVTANTSIESTKPVRLKPAMITIASTQNFERTAYLNFGTEIIKLFNIPRFAGSEPRGNADLTAYQLYLLELQGRIRGKVKRKGLMSTKRAVARLAEPYLVKSFREDGVRRSVILHRGVRVRELGLTCPGLFSEMLRNNNNHLRVETLELEDDKKGARRVDSFNFHASFNSLASEAGIMLKHSLHVDGSEDISC